MHLINEIFFLMINRRVAEVMAGTDLPPIIHYKITNSHPEFARDVLRLEVFHQVVQQNECLMASISPTEEELFSFQVHPMVGIAHHYQTLLKRTGIFLYGPIDNASMAREIIMYYQIYLDPVIVTSAEHYLWKCSPEELRRIAAAVGIPTGTDLVEEKRKHDMIAIIDKMAVIKTIADVSKIENCIPPTEASRFLLTVLRPSIDLTWYEKIVL